MEGRERERGKHLQKQELLNPSSVPTDLNNTMSTALRASHVRLGMQGQAYVHRHVCTQTHTADTETAHSARLGATLPCTPPTHMRTKAREHAGAHRAEQGPEVPTAAQGERHPQALRHAGATQKVPAHTGACARSWTHTAAASALSALPWGRRGAGTFCPSLPTTFQPQDGWSCNSCVLAVTRCK